MVEGVQEPRIPKRIASSLDGRKLIQELDSAFELYRRAISLRPTFVDAHANLAAAHMRKGEHAVLTINSDYGYGDHGSPPKIPGGATLVFDVEHLGFGQKKKENAL